MEINTLQIKRHYPTRKQKIKYPFRYSKENFDEYDKMINKEVLMNNYKKWKDGINYKTNRKITLGGKIHDSLKYDYMIKCENNEGNYCQNYTHVLFEKLNNINKGIYLLETEEIYKKIDNDNTLIKKYNEKIDNIISKINNLEKWNDFIEYNNEKYGISHYYGGIHRENNCLGKIVEGRYKECRCNLCESWGYNHGGTQYYNCNKCNKELYRD